MGEMRFDNYCRFSQARSCPGREAPDHGQANVPCDTSSPRRPYSNSRGCYSRSGAFRLDKIASMDDNLVVPLRGLVKLRHACSRWYNGDDKSNAALFKALPCGAFVFLVVPPDRGSALQQHTVRALLDSPRQVELPALADLPCRPIISVWIPSSSFRPT